MGKPTTWENQQSAYAKTKAQISFAVTAKLISAFVFATRIVQFLFYLNPKFQASSSFLCFYGLVCVRPFRKPHCWFSHEAAHMFKSKVRRGLLEEEVTLFVRLIYIFKQLSEEQSQSVRFISILFHLVASFITSCIIILISVI